MKFRITPLLILSIALILFGIPFILNLIGGNLGPPVGMLLIVVGLICLLLHFILGKFFKTKFRNQFIAELSLIIIIGLIYYRYNEKVILHLPKKFQGYITLVYGADKKPKLQGNNILTPNIDLTVPPSGIILTSSKYSKSFIVVDSSYGEIKTFHPGYGIPFEIDSLTCGNKKYNLNVLFIGNLPSGWHYGTDTTRRNMSKEMACKLLTN
jgi:hypothetical protein